MSTVSDVAGAFKKALYTAAQSVMPSGVQVSYGHPGMDLEDDVVAVMAVRATFDFATMSNALRTRELILECDVMTSCYRGGGPEAELVAGDRAYELTNLLEEYVRVTDTTLGGLVRHCFATSHASDGSTDPEFLARGRVIEVLTTYTARARITS